MKIGKVEDRGLIEFGPDQAQAAYWQGPLRRNEAQKIFDEYGAAIQSQAQGLIHLDLIISYLMDKFEIKPEEVTEWIQKKQKEVAEKVAAKQTAEGQPTSQPQSAETPKIILEN